MNPISTDSFSGAFLPSYTGANQSNATAGGQQLSTFAQLLGSAASSTAASEEKGASSKTNSPNQMLAQLMASFRSHGVANESASVDPMSIG